MQEGSKKPKGVYVIIENERLKKPIWTRVGTAWVNRDESLNIVLDALPIGGKLHVRDLWERDENNSEREAA